MLNKLILVVILLSFSCTRKQNGLFIGDHLKKVIKEQQYEYEMVYEKATKNNDESIKSFLLFIEKTDTESSFDHLENIQKLSNIVGLNKVKTIAKSCNSKVLDIAMRSIK